MLITDPIGFPSNANPRTEVKLLDETTLSSIGTAQVNEMKVPIKWRRKQS